MLRYWPWVWWPRRRQRQLHEQRPAGKCWQAQSVVVAIFNLSVLRRNSYEGLLAMSVSIEFVEQVSRVLLMIG